jgi:hypothetical protein
MFRILGEHIPSTVSLYVGEDITFKMLNLSFFSILLLIIRCDQSEFSY